MSENDYTGSPTEDNDELSRIEDELVGIEFDLDEDPLSFESDDTEQVINFGSVADGAKSLRDAAELLYDLADDLLAMSGEGWEIVDDVSGGFATAVRFDSDDPDSE